VILNVPSDLNAILGCDDLLQSFPSLDNGFAVMSRPSDQSTSKRQ
jgi:hypothetical protein